MQPAPVGTTALLILLAEDNPLNQRVTQLNMAKLGHSLGIVADGAMAVEAAKRTPYRVVLMDIDMPNLDGLEATRRIRSHYRNTSDGPYIIVLTASAQWADCLDAGMDDYLQKPIRVANLADTLSYALTTVATWRNQRHPRNDS